MAEETAAAPRQPATSWVSPESSVAPRNPGQLPLEASQEAIRSGEGGPQAAIQVEKKERGKEEEKTHDRRTRCKASIRPTTGKGEGLFATSAIGPSGLVLSQAPFAEFEMPLTSAGVEQALHAIDDEGRDLFWSFGGIGQEEGKDVDIAESSMIPFEGEMRGGMFETICRINHSCSPNARWVWRPQEGKMGESHAEQIGCSSSAVYALRSIKRGEEITASYLEEAELLAKNRELLIEDKYGFTCLCQVCSGGEWAIGPRAGRTVQTSSLLSSDGTRCRSTSGSRAPSQRHTIALTLSTR